MQPAKSLLTFGGFRRSLRSGGLGQPAFAPSAFASPLSAGLARGRSRSLGLFGLSQHFLSSSICLKFGDLLLRRAANPFGLAASFVIFSIALLLNASAFTVNAFLDFAIAQNLDRVVRVAHQQARIAQSSGPTTEPALERGQLAHVNDAERDAELAVM